MRTLKELKEARETYIPEYTKEQFEEDFSEWITYIEDAFIAGADAITFKNLPEHDKYRMMDKDDLKRMYLYLHQKYSTLKFEVNSDSDYYMELVYFSSINY